MPTLAHARGQGAIPLTPLLPSASPLTIGRSPSMDVVIVGDPSVSALHAQLSCLSEEWVLIDGGLSRNGTRVNGHRVTGAHRLHDGDLVQMGRTVLRFSDPPADNRHLPAGASADELLDLPRPQKAVLGALCGPLRQGPAALPATDTDIAGTLGVPIAAVQRCVQELYAFCGLERLNAAEARLALATAALAALDEAGDDRELVR